MERRSHMGDGGVDGRMLKEEDMKVDQGGRVVWAR